METEQLDVEVLGTSFLVDAADSQQPGVFVKTGRVRVSDDENEVVIIANEKSGTETRRTGSGYNRQPAAVFRTG